MSEIPIISKKQAAIFMLKTQGLHGKYKYHGEAGIVEFTASAGCVQYDPIDVCGKNHELVFLSRVGDFKRVMLHNALYKDRKMIDIYDKNMSMALLKDMPYLDHFKRRFNSKGPHKKDIDKIAIELIEYIEKNGPVCSSDIKFDKKVDWFWAPTSMARAALDTLYYRGELIIYERKNTRKYYDIAHKHIDKKFLDTSNPIKNSDELIAWHILRRIKSVGLLWNRSSDALLGIDGLNASNRNKAFNSWLSSGKIIEISVQDVQYPMYYWSGYNDIMKECVNNPGISSRTEFMAPLDNMLWDRRLITEIFDFEYKWEIYTPAVKRKYGYYVLPILHGNRIIGRIELSKNKKERTLDIVNVWYEKESYKTKKAEVGINRCLKRLNNFYFE